MRSKRHTSGGRRLPPTFEQPQHPLPWPPPRHDHRSTSFQPHSGMPAATTTSRAFCVPAGGTHRPQAAARATRRRWTTTHPTAAATGNECAVQLASVLWCTPPTPAVVEIGNLERTRKFWRVKEPARTTAGAIQGANWRVISQAPRIAPHSLLPSLGCRAAPSRLRSPLPFPLATQWPAPVPSRCSLPFV